MRLAACIAVVVVLALLCACEDEGADLTITEEDFGSVVRGEVGDVIDIALEANATTGYKWTCKWHPRARLKLLGEEYVADETGAVGAGGVQHFVLQSERHGKTVVTLQYRQPWEGGQRERPHKVTLRMAE